MRWLPLPALVLVASCSSVWSNCTALEQKPCDYTNLAASVCPAGTSCTPTGLCEPPQDAAPSDQAVGVDGSVSCAAQTGMPPAATLCNTGLCWENPLSQGKDLHAVWGAGPSQVWAVGNAGTILQWNGTRWSAVPSGVNSNLTGVWGSSASDVWAVGDGGVILHWNGSSWTRSTVSIGGSVGFTAVWGSSATDVWTVGGGGTILHWTAACAWTPVASGITTRLAAVTGTSASDAWAVGGGGAALHWDGKSWKLGNVGASAMNAPDLTGAWALSPDDVWAVGGSASFHWTGTTWAPVTTQLGATINGVWGSRSSAVWAVNDFGLSLWNGVTWTYINSNLQKPLYAVWGSSSGDIWAVGAYGSIMHSNGTAWTPVQVTNNLAAIAAFANDSSWAVGSQTTILQRSTGSSGGGSSGPIWTPVNVVTTSPVDLKGIWGSSAMAMWAVGDSMTILHGQADSWMQRKAPTSGSYSGVWGGNINSFWTITAAGKLMNWDGVLNGVASSDAGSPLFAIYGTSTTDMWLAGQGYVGHFDGMNLTPKNGLGQTYNGIWADSHKVWAVGTNSSIIHKFDTDIDWSFDSVTMPKPVTLNGIWGADAEHLWAVGNEGTLLKRVGMTWIPQSTGVTENLNAIAGLTAQNFWIVGNNGTILQYRGP